MHRAIILVSLAISIASFAAAQSATPAPDHKCPVSFNQLQMPYNHAGGRSVPQVVVSFTNDSTKKIAKAHFGLYVLDQQGSEHPYDQGLSFTAGVDPGKTTTSQWDLDATTVDIHRAGETIYLKSVRFEDGTIWKDDGNEKCRSEVNYSAR